MALESSIESAEYLGPVPAGVLQYGTCFLLLCVWSLDSNRTKNEVVLETWHKVSGQLLIG